jgi:hypothetical protein
MSPWITFVIVPFAIAIASLFAQFYFKWVPDAKDQRRQLKRAGIWLWNALFVGISVFNLILYSRDIAPFTAGFVMRAALAACLPLFYVTLVLLRYGINGLYRVLGGLPPTAEAVVAIGRAAENSAYILRGMIEALDALSNDPNLSAETVGVLRQILRGRTAT